MATETAKKPGAPRRKTTASAAKPAKPRAKASASTRASADAKTEEIKVEEIKTEARSHRSKRGSSASVASGVETADQVLGQLASGGQNVIGAVRKFVDQLDQTITGETAGYSKGHDVIDSALEMSDWIVGAGSDTIRGVVRTTGGQVAKVA